MKASQNTLWILRRFQPQFWLCPKLIANPCQQVAHEAQLKIRPSGFLVEPEDKLSRLQMQKTEKDLLFMKLYRNGFAFVCSWLER